MSVTEQELKERATAPRVTQEALDNNIAKIDYYVHPESCLTICILTLKNGFNVTAESACADPANFRQDIGERISLDNAKKKIWPLMGYVLKQELYEQSQKGKGSSFKDRLRAELVDLINKINKLNLFINGTVRFNELNKEHQNLLIKQRDYMYLYKEVLEERVNLLI